MKCVAIAVILVVLGCRSYGQASAEYEGCVNKSHAQSELNRCASDEAARVDAKLNAAYKNLLATIAGDSRATTKVREAERAWLRYRDAYIEAVYPAKDKQSAYGTVYPMDVNLLRAKLTREHVDAILYLVNEHQANQ